EVRCHDLVEAREVIEIGEVYGELHDVAKSAAGRRCDRSQVFEHAVHLRADAVHDLHARRIEPDLSGEVFRAPAAQGLRVRADRLGRTCSMYAALGHAISSGVFCRYDETPTTRFQS